MTEYYLFGTAINIHCYGLMVEVEQKKYNIFLPIIALFCNGKFHGFHEYKSGKKEAWFYFTNNYGYDHFKALICGFDKAPNYCSKYDDIPF